MRHAAVMRPLLTLGSLALLSGLAEAQTCPGERCPTSLLAAPSMRAALATTLSDGTLLATAQEPRSSWPTFLTPDASTVGALSVAPVFAARRSALPRISRATLSLSWAYAPQRLRFSETHTFTKYQEDGGRLQFDYNQRSSSGPSVDGRVTLWRGLGLQAGYSALRRKGSAKATAQVPHPLYFEHPRSLARDTSGLAWNESLTQVDVAYTLPVGPLRATAFAGISYLAVDADVIEKLVFQQTYPYDAANVTVSEAPAQRIRKNATGPDAGIALDLPIIGRFGVGAVIRYSGARVRLAHPTPPASSSEDAAVTLPQVLRPVPGVAMNIDARTLRLALGARVFF